MFAVFEFLPPDRGGHGPLSPLSAIPRHSLCLNLAESSAIMMNQFLLISKFNDFFSDDVIGVHCTHGLNRAGYVVCR